MDDFMTACKDRTKERLAGFLRCRSDLDWVDCSPGEKSFRSSGLGEINRRMDGNGYDWFNDMGYYIGYLEEYQKFLQARCDVGHAVVRHLDFLVDAHRSPGGAEAFAESEAAAKLAEDTSLMYVLMKYGVNERVHGADFDAYVAKTGSELYPDRAAVVRDRIMSGDAGDVLAEAKDFLASAEFVLEQEKNSIPGFHRAGKVTLGGASQRVFRSDDYLCFYYADISCLMNSYEAAQRAVNGEDVHRFNLSIFDVKPHAANDMRAIASVIKSGGNGHLMDGRAVMRDAGVMVPEPGRIVTRDNELDLSAFGFQDGICSSDNTLASWDNVKSAMRDCVESVFGDHPTELWNAQDACERGCAHMPLSASHRAYSPDGFKAMMDGKADAALALSKCLSLMSYAKGHFEKTDLDASPVDGMTAGNLKRLYALGMSWPNSLEHYGPRLPDFTQLPPDRLAAAAKACHAEFRATAGVIDAEHEAEERVRFDDPVYQFALTSTPFSPDDARKVIDKGRVYDFPPHYPDPVDYGYGDPGFDPDGDDALAVSAYELALAKCPEEPYSPEDWGVSFYSREMAAAYVQACASACNRKLAPGLFRPKDGSAFGLPGMEGCEMTGIVTSRDDFSQFVCLGTRHPDAFKAVEADIRDFAASHPILPSTKLSALQPVMDASATRGKSARRGLDAKAAEIEAQAGDAQSGMTYDD